MNILSEFALQIHERGHSKFIVKGLNKNFRFVFGVDYIEKTRTFISTYNRMIVAEQCKS